MEAALKGAIARETVKAVVLDEILVKYNNVVARANQQISLLQARIKELETGQGKYHSGLSWLGKIIFILKRTGHPLKASDLFEEIGKIDRDLSKRADPMNFLSAVLSDGVKSGRLILHRVKGTRGGYYFIEDWIDEHGNSFQELISELL